MSQEKKTLGQIFELSALRANCIYTSYAYIEQGRLEEKEGRKLWKFGLGDVGSACAGLVSAYAGIFETLKKVSMPVDSTLTTSVRLFLAAGVVLWVGSRLDAIWKNRQTCAVCSELGSGYLNLFTEATSFRTELQLLNAQEASARLAELTKKKMFLDSDKQYTVSGVRPPTGEGYEIARVYLNEHWSKGDERENFSLFPGLEKLEDTRS